MIHDRDNKVIFVSISERANEKRVREYVQHIGYKPVIFESEKHYA